MIHTSAQSFKKKRLNLEKKMEKMSTKFHVSPFNYKEPLQ